MAENKQVANKSGVAPPTIIVTVVIFILVAVGLSYGTVLVWNNVQLGIHKAQQEALIANDSHNATQIVVGTIGATGPMQARVVQLSDKSNLIIIPDSMAIIAVLFCGAFGGLIHSMRSFYAHLINLTLRNRDLPKFILRPFSGAILALIFYFVLRAGLGQPGPGNSNAGSSIIFYCAIAAVVGMFTDQTVEKLKKVADAFMSTPKEKKT